MQYLWGFFGIIILFGIAFLFSANWRKINYRPVLGGLIIQLIFAFAVLKWPYGKIILEKMTLAVNAVSGYAREGINFLVGGLFKEGSNIGFVFAFEVLPVIIFFSALISVLYYLKIMQIVIHFLGGGLAKLLKTSKPESMSAAANIFVGQTEAPLIIRPYLEKMSQSELFAVMTGGLASVAGSVLIGYSLMGVPLKYLLAASFMAAPAGLVMAKLFHPQTEEIQQIDDYHIAADEGVANVFDAAATGASVGLKLAANIGAMLLAFIALIALTNGILSSVGAWFGMEHLSLQLILGYLFAPLAFALGVPWNEAVQAGNFIGQKIVLNEFVAYSALGPALPQLTEKTGAILSFALCGFANLSSIAIQLGGLGGLAPSRREDIARMGLKAVMAGAMASMLSAAIAGMFL